MNDKKVRDLALLLMVLLVAFLALGIAGEGDYQEAQDQAEFYDEMVCKGLWADYEGRNPKCD